tara:strand:+ start:107 stop:658 length:552 start_codon:yes stop_codon:yes gene_type:complete
MKNFLLIVVILLLVSCSKTKTVLICGDHVCINKKEAEQYFEDNLSLEVKIIDKKEKNKIDLVELNLKSNENNVRTVSITEKRNTKENIKILSNDEIKEKKAELKKRKKISKLKDEKRKKKIIKDKIDKKKENKSINVQKTKHKSEKQIVDICVILEKCSIDEISKYLIEQGRKKGFPDITLRE